MRDGRQRSASVSPGGPHGPPNAQPRPRPCRSPIASLNGLPAATHWRATIAGTLGLLLGLAPLDSLRAQRLILREAQPLLRLEASRVAVLGVPDGDGAIGTPIAVARDRQGRFLVVSREFPDEIQIFSPSGAYLGKAGRSGEGPGEFRSVSQVFVLGDSIHILDTRLRRHSVLSKDLRHVRSESVPLELLGGGILPMPGGVLVANAVVRTLDALGNPLHVLRESRITASFGYAEGSIFPGGGNDWRALWPSTAGRFWAGQRLNYIIEEWTADGEKTRELVRRASWFPHRSEPYTSIAEGPAPQLRKLLQDESGRLWTLSAIPDERWRSTVVEGEPDAHGNRLSVLDPHRWNDSVIEVIDPNRGEVVASLRLDPYFAFLLDPGYVALSRVTDDNSVVEVWRLTLTSAAAPR